ncbi:MAG TPA: DUF1648 domain-containing protein [Permianibacter sp.]|nr:DUF1648 domain-containing protein [Permianibacter sp.]
MWLRYADRPRLQLTPSGLDKGLQLAGAVLLAVFLVVVAASWTLLPASLPVHFSLSGEPESWGERGEILLLPVIASLQFVLLSVLARFPHRHNYPVSITAANAEQQYRLAQRLLHVLSLLLVLLFFALYLATWAVASHVLARLPVLVMWLPLAAIGALLVWYWLRARQAR